MDAPATTPAPQTTAPATDAKAPVTTEATPQGGEAKAAAAEAMRKYKLKVDGEEVEVDEEELKRGYTHQRAANKKMQEGLRAKKQAEEFVRMMKDKGQLFEAIKKLGHDPRKLAEEYLITQLEDEMMDPKDKELKTYKTQLEQFQAKEKAAKEAQEKEAHEKLKAKYAEDYNKEFIEALKSTNLPPTKVMVAEMAKYIARAAAIQMPMTALEAAKLVQEDLDLFDKHRLQNADAEYLVKMLGEEGLNKVRTYDVSRLKDPAANLKTPQDQGEVTKRREHSKRMSPDEWRRFNKP